MSQVKRLGMGLGALIGGVETEPSIPALDAKAGGTATALADPVGALEGSMIHPHPYQPRAEFDEKEIQSLADSVRREGLLQPVVVRPVTGGFYQLVAGEPRWRASKVAGLGRVPAIVPAVD